MKNSRQNNREQLAKNNKTIDSSTSSLALNTPQLGIMHLFVYAIILRLLHFAFILFLLSLNVVCPSYPRPTGILLSKSGSPFGYRFTSSVVKYVWLCVLPSSTKVPVLFLGLNRQFQYINCGVIIYFPIYTKLNLNRIIVKTAETI